MQCLFELYWLQKLQQAETDYTEIPSWMKATSQLEKKHPDPCDKEPEERSDFFFRSQKMMTSKIKHRESEHTFKKFYYTKQSCECR